MATRNISGDARRAHLRIVTPAVIASAPTQGSRLELASGPDYYLFQTGNEFLELWHAEQAAWLQAEMFVNSAIDRGDSIDASMHSHEPTMMARTLHQ